MPSKKPDFGIRTTIVAGDYDSFKAALSRSIIGVTMKKFKKLHGRFFQTKSYNTTIVDQICKRSYEELQSHLQDVPLKSLRVNAVLKLNWDEDGRITHFSDMKLSVYQQLGELEIPSLAIRSATQKVKVDFFYQPKDFASQGVKKILDELTEDTGKEFFERNDYDFLNPESKKAAEAHRVTGTPTVVLNDNVVLENPSKNALQERINEQVAPSVTMKNAKYNMEASLPFITEKLLATIKG